MPEIIPDSSTLERAGSRFRRRAKGSSAWYLTRLATGLPDTRLRESPALPAAPETVCPSRSDGTILAELGRADGRGGGRVVHVLTHVNGSLPAVAVAGIETLDAAALGVAEAGERLGGCVLDGLPRRADHGDSLLTWAYSALAPGAPLVVTLPFRAPRRLPWRRSPVPVPGSDALRLQLERVRSQLFAHGFERPRVVAGAGHVVVSALRSGAAPPALRRHRLSVVVPVYNERSTFATMIEALAAKEIAGVDIEIVLVESNSTDGTRDEVLRWADHPRVRILLQDEARGKGNAVRAGLARSSGDFVLIQDADLEYDMADYERLLEPLRRFETAFVLGARKSAGHTWRIRHFGPDATLALLMNLGHLLFLFLFNTVYGQKLHDPFTMYKVFRRDAIFGLEFECDRFDFDWELTAKLIRAGYQPLEMQVAYRSRTFEEGKKVSLVRDPVTWVTACFKYRFSRLYTDR